MLRGFNSLITAYQVAGSSFSRSVGEASVKKMLWPYCLLLNGYHYFPMLARECLVNQAYNLMFVFARTDLSTEEGTLFYLTSIMF